MENRRYKKDILTTPAHLPIACTILPESRRQNSLVQDARRKHSYHQRWEWEQEKSIQTDLVKITHLTLVSPYVLLFHCCLSLFIQVYKHLGLYSLGLGQGAGRSSFSNSICWDFPGGPAVWTLSFQSRGCEFNPWSGN